MRSLLIDRPDRIGFSELAGTEPPVERKSVKAVAPAVAVGVHDGVEMVVVVSTGIDLELLPYAADARMRTAPDTPLVVVVPERDAHPITQRLADALAEPARVVTVDNDWRSWS